MGEKKKVEKQIESLEKQIKIHEKKIKEFGHERDYLPEYWNKQVKLFKEEIERKKRKLRDSD